MSELVIKNGDYKSKLAIHDMFPNAEDAGQQTQIKRFRISIHSWRMRIQ